MFNNVSCVPHYNGSSSYYTSGVFSHGNPHGISHVRKHSNKVQERNLRTNRSGYDSIGNNITDGGITHGNRHRTGMQNMNNGTTNHYSVQPYDNNDLRHIMSNNVIQVLNHNVKIS